MPDIVKERLELIVEHSNVIEERTFTVVGPDELKDTNEGPMLLDSLITRLQALAETLKRFKNLSHPFLMQALR
jgi:hypothetical protein